MYEAADDLYCYPGTGILINKLGIRDADRLEAFEEEMTRERAAEPLPTGRLSVRHFKAVHHHLFRDVYSWAGRPRRLRIAKADSMFCYPEHIPSELGRLFDWLRSQRYFRGLPIGEFAVSAAHFLAELNAIHAFRDGNGRAQLTFMALLAAQAGHPFSFERLAPRSFLAAMIAGFKGDETMLASQIHRLAEPG